MDMLVVHGLNFHQLSSVHPADAYFSNNVKVKKAGKTSPTSLITNEYLLATNKQSLLRLFTTWSFSQANFHRKKKGNRL